MTVSLSGVLSSGRDIFRLASAVLVVLMSRTLTGHGEQGAEPEAQTIKLARADRRHRAAAADVRS
jgi:hypothetical protein